MLAVAVKVTEVPAQIVSAVDPRVTVGVTLGVTVTTASSPIGAVQPPVVRVANTV